MIENLADRLRLLAVAFSICMAAHGQAAMTASQPMELSVFGAATRTGTGLKDLNGNVGRNAAITAGVDLAFSTYFGIRPALEIRCTYPIMSGNVVGEESGLIGFRFMKTYHRVNPYFAAFYGRGAQNYVNGKVIGTFRYDRTTSNVFAGGGGIDISLTSQFDIKADAQLQHWSTPVTDSGKIYSTPVSIGVVYRFDFNHHAKRRTELPAGNTSPPPPSNL
jgi:hypothetical protein